MWVVTYSQGGWRGIVRPRDRDCAVATAHRLASEGKSEIAALGPDGMIQRDGSAKEDPTG
jgi:hypothetical protein